MAMMTMQVHRVSREAKDEEVEVEVRRGALLLPLGGTGARRWGTWDMVRPPETKMKMKQKPKNGSEKKRLARRGGDSAT